MHTKVISPSWVLLIVLILVIGISYALVAGPAVIYDVVENADRQKTNRSVPNKAFTIGEKLTFDIDWGPTTVGTTVMAVPLIKKFNGHDVYEIRSRTLSNKVISTFYPVDDQLISYIDTAGIYSVRFEKNLNEGTWHQRRLFILDQDKNLAYSRQDTVEIPEYCQDVLSAFFYVRTQNLKIGETLEIPHYDNDKIYNIVVEVLKRQQIRVPAGKFDCIVVEPKLKTQGLFKHQGRIKIYLTDDEKKIPVLIVSKVIFGQIAIKLTKIESEILP